MDSTNRNRRVGSAGLVLLFLIPSVSLGAEFGGGIRIGVSHTDNVFLSVSPNEIDDIVYQASPWLSFIHESSQLDANLRYTVDWFRYGDLETTSNFHRGMASITAKAWDESLKAEFGARRSQTLADPADVIPPGRLPLSGNLIDQDEWWFNPRLNRTLGNTVTLDADYRYSRIQYDEPLTQDNENQIGAFRLENYKAGRGLTWALRYDWRRVEYEVSAPWEHQQVTAELGFWVSDKTRLFGAGGQESEWDNPFDSALEDSFWEAGFAHSPGDKLAAEFAVGDRSFGTSWRGKLDYTFRTGSTSLSYDESPTTIGFNRIGGTRSVLDPDDLDDFLDRPGRAERFLSERLQWNLNLKFRKIGFDLAVFNEDRSSRIDDIGTPLDDQSQTGVMVSFPWQVGVRSELVASGAIVDQEIGLENRSKFLRARLNFNFRLGRRSEISLGYSYNEQEPRGANASGRDYVANVVSLFFTITM